MWEVLIPAAKETLQDMITKGTGLLLYGEDAHTRRSSSRRGPTISYGRYFDDGRNERARPRRDTVRGSRGSVLENIVFDDEHDANTVFEILISHLETYGHVSVSDYYDAANVGHLGDYTDNNWGWTNMSRARVIRSRDGYELILPEPRALD